MASELRVNTLKDASGNNSVATSVVFNGTLKMWADLSGSGTPAIDDSTNTSSVTDVDVGERRINLTSSMTNTNYMAVAGMIQDGNSGSARGAASHHCGTKATGSIQYKIFYGSTASSDGDETDSATIDGCAIAGDLA